ncbi:hypothetical protein FRC12_021992, partial [Ceratobasidium sp. 428]
QQSIAPAIQWSDAPVVQNGQSMWLSEATMSNRTIAQSIAPSKSTAQNECARQLLIYFKVPHS